MTRPGQNKDAAYVQAMVRAHGGHWRPHLIDADFYDTPRAVALIDERLAHARG